MSMKNSKDTLGNRTRDLPACSAVPQPTAPPRVPRFHPHTEIKMRFSKLPVLLTQTFQNARKSFNKSWKKVCGLGAFWWWGEAPYILVAEGSTFLRNFGKCVPSDTASHPTELDSITQCFGNSSLLSEWQHGCSEGSEANAQRETYKRDLPQRNTA
jgi:hypothetical protein